MNCTGRGNRNENERIWKSKETRTHWVLGECRTFFREVFQEKNDGLGACSGHDDVRGAVEDGDGGDDGEEREEDEADAVDDHGGELPVVGRLLLLVVGAQLVRDDAQLLQNGRQLAVRTETARTQRRRLVATCKKKNKNKTKTQRRVNSFSIEGAEETVGRPVGRDPPV